MEQEKKVWDLTKKHAGELEVVCAKHEAVARLTEILLKQTAQVVKEEGRWWEKARKHYGLPWEDRKALIASPTAGKIWIRGAVPELAKYE